jgi:hypothetical protein
MSEKYVQIQYITEARNSNLLATTSIDLVKFSRPTRALSSYQRTTQMRKTENS